MSNLDYLHLMSDMSEVGDQTSKALSDISSGFLCSTGSSSGHTA